MINSVTKNADESKEKAERLFQPIGLSAQEAAENDDDDGMQPVTVVESLCMNCGENGVSRIMLTLIPHFKEVILMAFECEHCGFKNNEIQSGSAVHDFGSVQSCRVKTKEDLNRQVVKAESATVKLLELGFEIPPATQRGVLTTIEGLLSKAIESLSQLQPVRKIQDETLYSKLEEVIASLQSYLDNAVEFTIEITDPAGNSYIENTCAPNKDPQMKITVFRRTAEMNEELGLQPEQEDLLNAGGVPEELVADELNAAELNDDLANEVHIFHGNCSRCNAPSDTRMHIMDIPHFKEVVIMATDCELCGYKSNEVKAGGAISPVGKKITLKIHDPEDLNRDILKSETCGLEIPEIELDLTTGTLGGRFTTVEGLLSQVYDELEKTASSFVAGDSGSGQRKVAFERFLEKLQKALKVEMPYTLILDDPLGNSYLQNIYAPDPDPDMTIETYQRTYDQNEVFGLNDLVLENYGEAAGTSISASQGIKK